MKRIYLIDDLEKSFGQTSISNLIKMLDAYYDKMDREKRTYTIVVPTIGEQDEINRKKEDRITSLLSETQISCDYIFVNIGTNPYHNVNDTVSCITNKIQGAISDQNVRILIDICLVKGDTGRLTSGQDVISVHLFGKLSTKSFLYTQYPANEFLYAWYSRLDELYSAIEPKRIYFRGDIDGEGKFDKDFADKIIGEI